METSVYVDRLLFALFRARSVLRTPAAASSATVTTAAGGSASSQGIQVTDNIEVIVQVERDIVSSNLALYGYTSNSVVLGPQIKF